MKTTLIRMILFIISSKLVNADFCYFDFEQTDELQNFDPTCNGIIGAWSIVDTPKIPSLQFETGQSALTSAKDKTACMSTAKKFDLPQNLKITADFFIKIVNYFDSLEVSIELRSDDISTPTSTRKIYEPGLPPNGDGQWERKELSFTNDAGEYKIVINMFRNGDAEVLLDKILVENVSSEDCYVVPKLTTSTTEPTTISTDSTTISTTEPTTTSTEPTTIPTDSTTISTTEPTKTSTEPTTISTDSTTISTTEPTTISTDSTTISTDSTTISTKPTTISTDSTTTSTAPTTISTDSTTITGSPTISTTDFPETSPTESQSTIKPGSNYPDFSFFYFVIIIAASGGLLIISGCVTFTILRKGRSTRKTKRKNIEHMHRA